MAKSQKNQMGKPPLWFKKAVAWFGVALFVGDTGSDGYVGGSLIYRCHTYYGSSVISFFYIPGLLSGGLFSILFVGEFLKDKCGYKTSFCSAGFWINTLLFIIGTILGPFVFVPAGLFVLVKAALDPFGEKEDRFPKAAKLLKGFEMIFESYPQMLLSIFIMQSLQVTEWFNIGSCIISTFSVVYGYAELLAMLSHNYETNYPFAKTMWGMAALLVDTLLRALSIAYLMTFFKEYILLLPLMYFVLMLIIGVPTYLFKNKNDINGCKDFFEELRIGFLFSGGYALVSFGCSAFEGPRDKDGKDDFELNLNLRLRPLSKAVYSIVLITFAIYFGFTIAPGLLSKDSGSMITPYNTTLDAKYNSSNCESLCPREGFNVTEIPDLESYCNNLQYYIPVNTHYAMWITIAVLFYLSWMELALEASGTFMPYHKALEPVPWIHEEKEAKEREREEKWLQEREERLNAQKKNESQEDDKSESSSSNNENQLEQDPDAIALQPISESPQDDPLPV